MWKSIKNWIQEWIFFLYKSKWGRSRWLAYFQNWLQNWFGDRFRKFPSRFPTRFPAKFPARFPTAFPTRFPTAFPARFPARFSRKIFPQDFPTRFSQKLFPSWILIGWLPITLFQMLNFHQSLSFLNWLFTLLPVPQDFPARFSHKIFLQDFPTRICHKIFQQEQDFPELDPDWLASHHPIANAKFPPITALLNMPIFHKRTKVSPPPFPQILWEPQIN